METGMEKLTTVSGRSPHARLAASECEGGTAAPSKTGVRLESLESWLRDVEVVLGAAGALVLDGHSDGLALVADLHAGLADGVELGVGGAEVRGTRGDDHVAVGVQRLTARTSSDARVKGKVAFDGRSHFESTTCHTRE